jgi:L-lactate utilization protein LutB
MTAVETWRGETLGNRVCAALKKNGFEARYVATAAEARDAVAAAVKPGMKVGLGGSVTLTSIGVPEKVLALGGEILNHSAPGLSEEQKMEVRRAQLTCDLFLSGSNAVTLAGEIVNVDGGGNRVAALTFGPKKTIVVMGANKIVRDLEEAQERIEMTAAPMNNKRLDKPNPCVKAGFCQDCHQETRICNVYQVLRRRPAYSDFTVIIVGEPLGF